MQTLSPVEEERFPDDGIEWGDNLLQIIEDDERRFYKENRHSLVIEKDIEQDDTMQNELDLSTLSWGNYFSKKSPAVSEIFEPEVQTLSERDVSLESFTSNHNNNHCESEQHSENQEDDSLLSIPSRNSSHCHRHSWNNIHISSLGHIQRFYQFTVKPEYKQQIERIISRYVGEHSASNHMEQQLLAVTVNQETLRCTVLTQIYNAYSTTNMGQRLSHNQWIGHFLSDPVVCRVLDLSEEPTFTQLSNEAAL